MKEILSFLTLLGQNNNKPWFDEHKAQYLDVKKRFDAFAMEFARGVAEFDPRCEGLQLRDITYRIYRDLRFSQDKRPYKDWFGVYVCPGGKKSGMAGYYIHLQPATNTYFLCGGLYNPTKEVVKSVREMIMLEPEQLLAALKQCDDFTLPWDAALKKVPQGYSDTDEQSPYYRLKSYEIYKSITKRDVLKKDFLQTALADLRRTHDYNEMLNRSVDYAREVMF